MLPPPLKQTLDWLLSVEDPAASREVLRAVLRRNPDHDAESLAELAQLLFQSKEFKKAEALSRQVLDLRPDSVDAKLNFATSTLLAGDAITSENIFRELLARRPEWDGVRMNLGLALTFQGKFAHAEKEFRTIASTSLASEANRRIARYNLSSFEFARGDFRKGMADLASGRGIGLWGSRIHPIELNPFTPGADLRGKTVLISGEGGAGDEILNIRFAKELHARGARCTALSRHGLEPLFERIPEIERVLTERNFAENRFDFVVPAMDLPYLLELAPPHLRPAPYLKADPARVEKWRSRVRISNRPKVGIRWKGNAYFDTEGYRSVPVGALLSLGDAAIDLYSLQRDEGAEDLPKNAGVSEWGKDLKDWEDTAAAIANLDLVISSCTSVAHLAAAMGKPTWILAPLNSYYIWIGSGKSSPWYDSVRLFRQRSYGSWEDPIRELRSALNQGI